MYTDISTTVYRVLLNATVSGISFWHPKINKHSTISNSTTPIPHIHPSENKYHTHSPHTRLKDDNTARIAAVRNACRREPHTVRHCCCLRARLSSDVTHREIAYNPVTPEQETCSPVLSNPREHVQY